MTVEQMLKQICDSGRSLSMGSQRIGYNATLKSVEGATVQSFVGFDSPAILVRRAWEWCQQTDDMFPCDRCGECFTELQDVGAFEGGQMCGPCLVSELNERHEGGEGC